MTKILVIADEDNAVYHPYHNIGNDLEKALGQMGIVEVCFCYKQLDVAALNSFDFVVNYLDNYKTLGTYDNVLADFIIHGGHMLVIHNGIITPPKSRLEQCYGGRFITHPPYCTLEYKMNKGINGPCINHFFMEEEPYMIEETDDRNQVFLTFAYDHKEYIAGWTRNVGNGKVVCLLPGHDQRTSGKEVFQNLVLECAEYIDNAREDLK